jgi:hypothetical protein
MYKIEKNIPIGFIKQPKYPFSKMIVGDSFFVKGDKKKINAVTVSASSYKKNTPGTNFTSRCTEGGIRVWRIA